MRALEFEAKLGDDRTLTVPSEIARQVPADAPVRVILLVSEEDLDSSWARLAARQFLEGYAPEDAVYDQL